MQRPLKFKVLLNFAVNFSKIQPQLTLTSFRQFAATTAASYLDFYRTVYDNLTSYKFIT